MGEASETLDSARSTNMDVARKVKAAAASNNASRTIANYLAQDIIAQSYSSPQLSNVYSGAEFSQKIIQSLDSAAAKIKQFEMKELVGVDDDRVTISTYKAGRTPDGEAFEDNTIATYTLADGRVVRSDSAHMNTGGLIKLLTGDSSLADSDARTAAQIAQQMRDFDGFPSVQVLEPYLAEKVAMFFLDSPERNMLADSRLLKDAFVNEPAAFNRALNDWVLKDDRIEAQANAIVIKGRWTGTLKSDGSSLWGDEDMIAYVVSGRIAAWSNNHSSEAMANIHKALSAGGFDMNAIANAR
jgi:hypothetical protein